MSYSPFPGDPKASLCAPFHIGNHLSLRQDIPGTVSCLIQFIQSLQSLLDIKQILGIQQAVCLADQISAAKILIDLYTVLITLATDDKLRHSLVPVIVVFAITVVID